MIINFEKNNEEDRFALKKVVFLQPHLSIKRETRRGG